MYLKGKEGSVIDASGSASATAEIYSRYALASTFSTLGSLDRH